MRLAVGASSACPVYLMWHGERSLVFLFPDPENVLTVSDQESAPLVAGAKAGPQLWRSRLTPSSYPAIRHGSDHRAVNLSRDKDRSVRVVLGYHRSD